MSLVLGDNFNYQANKPLDGRIKYNDVATMKAVADATIYDGCIAYCVATGKTYQWKSTNEVDETLGKWREFTSGGSGGTTDYSDLDNKPSIENVTLSGNKSASDLGLAKTSDLATVATSGDYDDLSNKPSIPDELADLNDDSTHRLVTDNEKTTWNGKSAVSVTQVQSSGTKIATVNIDGADTDLYAPSGGGGTSDYTELSNKPQIEGTTLTGNKTASDLGLAKVTELTSAQYAELSQAEKMNGTLYFITDGDGGGAYSIQKATLQSGATTVTFTVPTTGDYLLNVYTSDGRNYTDVDLSVSGSATLTFNAPSSAVTVYLELKGV